MKQLQFNFTKYRSIRTLKTWELIHWSIQYFEMNVFMKWNEKIENGIVLLLMMIIDKHTINLSWSFKIECFRAAAMRFMLYTNARECFNESSFHRKSLSFSFSFTSLASKAISSTNTHTLYIQCHSQIEMQTEFFFYLFSSLSPYSSNWNMI